MDLSKQEIQFGYYYSEEELKWMLLSNTLGAKVFVEPKVDSTFRRGDEVFHFGEELQKGNVRYLFLYSNNYDSFFDPYLVYEITATSVISKGALLKGGFKTEWLDPDADDYYLFLLGEEYKLKGFYDLGSLIHIMFPGDRGSGYFEGNYCGFPVILPIPEFLYVAAIRAENGDYASVFQKASECKSESLDAPVKKERNWPEVEVKVPEKQRVFKSFNEYAPQELNPVRRFANRYTADDWEMWLYHYNEDGPEDYPIDDKGNPEMQPFFDSINRSLWELGFEEMEHRRQIRPLYEKYSTDEIGEAYFDGVRKYYEEHKKI